MSLNKSKPPDVDIVGGRILNFNEIREWALRNDPLWHSLEFKANAAGLDSWETLELLLVGFLKHTHDLDDLLFRHMTMHGPPFAFVPFDPEKTPEVKP